MTDGLLTEKEFNEYLELAMQVPKRRLAIVIDPASDFYGHTVVMEKEKGAWLLHDCHCHDRDGRRRDSE